MNSLASTRTIVGDKTERVVLASLVSVSTHCEPKHTECECIYLYSDQGNSKPLKWREFIIHRLNGTMKIY